MEQIVDGLGKIVEGINSVDAALDSNRVNEIIYVKINNKSTKLTSLIHKLSGQSSRLVIGRSGVRLPSPAPSD